MSVSKISLECPFTWKINEKLAFDYEETDEPVIEVDEQPAMALISSTTITYIRTVQKDYDGAENNLKKTAEIWNEIDKRELMEESISSDVLFHIMKATEYHLYKTLKKDYEAEKSLKDIIDSKNFKNKVEIGTISGCKSIAWSIFHEHACNQALACAEQAVLNSPNCPLWYLILGKSHRHKRRNEIYNLKPSVHETNAFTKCYTLSQKPFYAVQVAQMYREQYDTKMCKEIYEKVYAAKPVSPRIQLRLARAFTAFKDFDKAKSCLDYAEKHCPENAMFLHYKGSYFEKLKDYEKAAAYLKKSVKNGNYRADLQYAACMKRLDAKFDYIQHLKTMLERYTSNSVTQQITLHIAMQYYYYRKNIKNALLYFLKAIQLNAESEQLQKFFNTTVDWKEVNIFNFIYYKLLPEFRRSSSTVSVDEKNMLQALKDLCEERVSRNNSLSKSFNKMHLK